MKILFAVNDEKVSEAIIQRYQKDYKEIISSKNVYYYNAIIKELQKDKSYDRIIIGEDLEPFSTDDYTSIDKFLFDKLDKISDEAYNTVGNDIPIILICTDRRSKPEPLLVKLFGISIYNALIGQDRSIDEVCKLIKKPRSKKDAKIYYRIDSDKVEYKPENKETVSETEIQNILAHYKKLGNNIEKHVKSFSSIASQYNDEQLRLIVNVLPKNNTKILEQNSPEYRELLGLSPIDTENTNSIHMQNIGSQISKSNLSSNIIIPGTVNTKKVKKIIEEDKTEIVDDKKIKNISNSYIPEEGTVQKQNISAEEIIKTPKRRGRPPKIKENEENINVTSTDIQEQEQTVPTVKRRGRPPKIKQENINTTETNLKTEEKDENQIPGFEDELEEDILPGFEDYELPEFDEEESDVLPGFEEDAAIAKIKNSSNTENEENTISEETEDDTDINEYNVDEISNFNGPIQNINFNNTNTNGNINNSIQNRNINNTQMNVNIDNLISSDKKIVSFVGTTKNGTSFLVNNVAQMLSEKGIKTAILDLTQNKNAYYVYTDNRDDLRNIASKCIKNLKTGVAEGIEINQNLTVYTSIPEETNETKDSSQIIQTLLGNYSLILLDCDYLTELSYFNLSQEIYLVQSLDVLTIQPLTAFLRELKAKNILDANKLRVVINKYVRSQITNKMIIGGISSYNDPSMSYMTELFNKDRMKYITIPFEIQNYAKYLEYLVDCKISLRGYTKNFIKSLDELSNNVFPLINNAKNNSKNYFSTKTNSTLNKMKTKY